MTARELLEYEIALVGKQVEKTVDGLSESQLDLKDTPASMSARETLSHLCEAYDAFAAVSRGEKYEWGSFQSSAQDKNALLNEWTRMRAKAVSALTDDDECLKHAYDYIVGHDNYHVGHLAHLRMAAQPEWDTMELYG